MVFVFKRVLIKCQLKVSNHDTPADPLKEYLIKHKVILNTKTEELKPNEYVANINIVLNLNLSSLFFENIKMLIHELVVNLLDSENHLTFKKDNLD